MDYIGIKVNTMKLNPNDVLESIKNSECIQEMLERNSLCGEFIFNEDFYKVDISRFIITFVFNTCYRILKFYIINNFLYMDIRLMNKDSDEIVKDVINVYGKESNLFRLRALYNTSIIYPITVDLFCDDEVLNKCKKERKEVTV